MKVAWLQSTWTENLGPAWISAVLKSKGHTSEFFFEQRGWRKDLKKYGPDLIAFSCTTGIHSWARETARQLKKEGFDRVPVLMGGSHPTFYPEIIYDEGIDIICRGEGEGAVLELVETLADRGDTAKIENLWVKRDGGVFSNELRPLIADLDDLPHPDRGYCDKYPLLGQYPYKSIVTGRGCPFSCSFCFNAELRRIYQEKGKYLRRRSVGKVIEEIAELKERYALRSVRFVDDVFTLDKDWLREFIPVYRREIGLPFTCNVKPELMDEEVAGLLKESGCRLALFGIESGSERIRNEIMNKNLSDQQIISCASGLRKYGIEFATFNIIGSPGETLKDARATVEINQRIRTRYPWCSLMQFYPGTEIYRIARAQGVLNEESGGGKGHDEVGMTYFRETQLRQDNKAELVNLHRFFVILVRFPFLSPLIRQLIKLRPNFLFDSVFLISYAYITLRRSEMGIRKLIRLGLKSLSLFWK
ncbi:MAG: B12-binding domain-containing radical SAM protein [Deltaproteobacteria bacterium]|nr:MAG: B12-binding domain-containing radical SAM protein [Deltaproteobacteria bacterium]